jgi:acetyl esterase/lipase
MKITLDLIDPELRELAEPMMGVSIDDEEAFRQGMEAGTMMVDRTPPEDMRFDEVWIPRSKGGAEQRLIILKPLSQEEMLPGILWIHGGAFASGVPESSMSVFRRLMNAHPCVIVSPDYRLSLEAPYPAGVDDCYDALLWVKEHAKELGIREDQIVVGGDSSGASFAVTITMMARDLGTVDIAFQMPLFPALDDTMTSESMKDNNSPFIDRNICYQMWRLYLGDFFETDDVPVYAAPARADDYGGLPPCISYVGGIDPLRDDGIAYTDNLKNAGIPVHFQVFEGCFHGFEEFCPDAAVSLRAKEFFIETYRYAVEHYFAEQRG